MNKKCSSKLDYDALKKGVLIDNKCKQQIIDLAIKIWGKDENKKTLAKIFSYVPKFISGNYKRKLKESKK